MRDGQDSPRLYSLLCTCPLMFHNRPGRSDARLDAGRRAHGASEQPRRSRGRDRRLEPSVSGVSLAGWGGLGVGDRLGPWSVVVGPRSDCGVSTGCYLARQWTGHARPQRHIVIVHRADAACEDWNIERLTFTRTSQLLSGVSDRPQRAVQVSTPQGGW